MSSSSRQLRRQLEKLLPESKEALADLKANEVEVLAADHEIGPERASQLQPQVGNQALLSMLNTAGRGNASQGPDMEGAGEEMGEAVEQESEQELTLEQNPESVFARSLGQGVVPQSFDQEDWGLLYGGDDEPAPEPPADQRRRFRRSRSVPPLSNRRQETGPEAEDLDGTVELPPLFEAGDPRGDEVADAIWGWLQDPAEMADGALEPEDLVDCPAPLRRCITLGGFLAQGAQAPVARALGRLAGPLPGGPGLATQVARAAAMCTLGLLVEGGDQRLDAVNRAGRVALEEDAVAHGLHAGRVCIREERLAAHLVFDTALADPEPAVPVSAPGRVAPDRRAVGLMEAALRYVVGPWVMPEPPSYRPAQTVDTTSSPETAAIDALLREQTQAEDGPEVVDDDALTQMLAGASRVLGAAERTHIELAAAALSVERATRAGLRLRIRAMLRAADRELRVVGRDVARAADAVEAQAGQELDAALPALVAGEQALAEAHQRITRLRESGFSALGVIALSVPA